MGVETYFSYSVPCKFKEDKNERPYRQDLMYTSNGENEATAAAAVTMAIYKIISSRKI